MNKFILSIRKNFKGIIFIFIASLMTAFGQMFWKMFNNEKAMLYLIIGFLLYGIGAVLMVIALRFGSLSVLHPMLSFGYIFAVILGVLILKEKVTLLTIIAVFIIMAGVVLIGGGDE